MKKIVLFLLAIIALAACSKREQTAFNYRGLEFSMPASQMIQSLEERGFRVDSAASDSGHTVVLVKAGEIYHVIIAFQGDEIKALQETYLVSTNDSTRKLWQERRDALEKELGAWPDCPMLKKDHKIANFDASDGFISVILENTYKPKFNVLYTPKKK